jgi:hypothetical protein
MAACMFFFNGRTLVFWNAVEQQIHIIYSCCIFLVNIPKTRTLCSTNKNGVGIVADKNFKDGVVDIKRQENKIILVKLLVGDLIFNVISAYVT